MKVWMRIWPEDGEVSPFNWGEFYPLRPVDCVMADGSYEARFI